MSQSPPEHSAPRLAAIEAENAELNRHIKELDKLLQRLDNSGVHQYVKLSQRTGKILWLNFISGVARGLGFTVGTAIVLAIVYKILSTLISMNIPYLTEMLLELVELVQTPQR